MVTRVMILGCGNMARAISLGLDGNEDESFQFLLHNPSLAKSELLAQELKNAVVYPSLEEIPEADIYFIACKPQQFPVLAPRLQGRLAKDSIALSVMAALDIKLIQEQLHHQRVVRIMPNTLVRVNQGIGLFACSDTISADEQHLFKNMFSRCMEFFDIPEDKFDKITPLLGSGSAFIFWLLENMEKQALCDLKGLVTQDKLRSIFKKLLFGSALLANEDKIGGFAGLIEEIRSKKGITDACLVSLDSQCKDGLINAIEQGHKRAKQLSSELGG